MADDLALGAGNPEALRHSRGVTSDLHWQEHCAKCFGKQVAEAHWQSARFSVLIPSACPTKDECERKILSKAGIGPHTTPTGEIVR